MTAEWGTAAAAAVVVAALAGLLLKAPYWLRAAWFFVVGLMTRRGRRSRNSVGYAGRSAAAIAWWFFGLVQPEFSYLGG